MALYGGRLSPAQSKAAGCGPVPGQASTGEETADSTRPATLGASARHRRWRSQDATGGQSPTPPPRQPLLGGNRLRRGLETLEPHRKPVSIRAILDAAWQVDRPTIKTLQDFKHRTVALAQQAVSNM